MGWSEPLWLDLDEGARIGEQPLLWLIADNEPRWEKRLLRVRAAGEDLADAALFTSPDRSGARLRRRLLLRSLCAQALGVDPGAVRIVRSAEGACTVAAPRLLHVSLAARAGWTLIGLAGEPIGVDLETASPAPPLPLDLLHPDEATSVLARDPADRALAFARFWAAKEAALKATGRGLLDGSSHLRARFEGDRCWLDVDGRTLAEALVRPAGPGVAAVARLAS